MSWLKNVLIDLVVTAVIAVYVFTSADWGYWIIVIYTPLMLLLKIGAVTSGVAAKVKKDADAAPDWFFHLLYGANFVLLLYGSWWLLAGAWALIWMLSAVQAARSSAKK